MKATISIVCHLAFAQAKTCIASVMNANCKTKFDLILTANGNDQAAQYFNDLRDRFANIFVVKNDTNEGFIGPQTTAFKFCQTDLFIMLNDDCVVPCGWLDKIVAEFESHTNAAVVGPVGRRLRDNFVGGLSCDAKNPPEYIEGVCFAIRTDLTKKHGLFDPALEFAYGEESDLCLRMRQLGHTIHVSKFPIIHQAGTTSRHVPEAQTHFIKNHTYLRDKWSDYLKTHKFPYE
jgi:GT2 family glycosyltransferase